MQRLRCKKKIHFVCKTSSFGPESPDVEPQGIKRLSRCQNFESSDEKNHPESKIFSKVEKVRTKTYPDEKLPGRTYFEKMEMGDGLPQATQSSHHVIRYESHDGNLPG